MLTIDKRKKLIMAEANIIPVFQNLAAEMANVSSSLSAQGFSQTVQTFDGNPSNFKDWLKQVKTCKTWMTYN